LFAAPTGTGKTEFAKTLAEYLFGAPERMAWLDMSEFQSPDSLGKILGRRKQPFSVVLLDEFEKAHGNVWDLCLRIFDDGRVADFRHTIIILTSNLGATAHRGGMLGFMAAASAYGEQQVQRAVVQTFRPEFVNQLDKIIVFRPPSRGLMRDSVRKELAAVLEQRAPAGEQFLFVRSNGRAIEVEFVDPDAEPPG
jgi:ATP-dependent Clp protease ATP-binding subunit ClpC